MKRIKGEEILFVFLLISIFIISLIFLAGTKKAKEEMLEKPGRPVFELEKTVYKPEEEIEAKQLKESYRLTSYYPGDDTGSGEWVGAGYHIFNFEINDKGWYTFDGKLVLAGATNECLNAKKGACGKWNAPKDNKTYFNYHDEVTIVIDGLEYEGIILDSCGACMDLEENRIDLFVINKESMIDRGYRGENMVEVIKYE